MKTTESIFEGLSFSPNEEYDIACVVSSMRSLLEEAYKGSSIAWGSSVFFMNDGDNMRELIAAMMDGTSSAFITDVDDVTVEVPGRDVAAFISSLRKERKSSMDKYDEILSTILSAETVEELFKNVTVI